MYPVCGELIYYIVIWFKNLLTFWVLKWLFLIAWMTTANVVSEFLYSKVELQKENQQVRSPGIPTYAVRRLKKLPPAVSPQVIVAEGGWS